MEDNNKIITDPVKDDSAQIQTEPVNNEPQERTFTQSELDAIIEKRLAKERRNIEKRIKDEVDEAARLAQMSEAERQQALFDKRVKEFEEKERAFAEAQAALSKEKMLNETNKQLADRGLPIEFATQLMADTAEDTLKNIENFEAKWNSAMKKAVESKIKGSTPTSPVSKDNTTEITKDSFRKMPLSQQQKLAIDNPELYKELTKR